MNCKITFKYDKIQNPRGEKQNVLYKKIKEKLRINETLPPQTLPEDSNLTEELYPTNRFEPKNPTRGFEPNLRTLPEDSIRTEEPYPRIRT